ncbi:hypothetical protein [Mycobacterium sp. AZCC_0083]|uniref:hypothetical protein n=1 Tax=Mycobacterium sp. AZCC_0083 TaxID=2735882 RepID=UPI001619827A|nr:hypothetical protein [Mycobacterium sp. AZCC_0083]MBB5163524.1 hypothetical protein [Mycobacterium sp. AZCC_0083]
MPDQDTTIDQEAAIDPETTIDEAQAAEEVRSEPTEVTVVEVVNTDDDRAEIDGGERESTRSIVIRHVLERQLVAGQGLSTQLVDAATDVTVALAQAPAGVVGEIRGGATLPTAFARTGTSVREVVTGAGGRVRSAVGEYVGNQATLPNAVVVGAADVAETVVRAQGTVTASALNAAFTLATSATQGGDLREVFSRERHEVGAVADAARGRIGESVSRARDEIRSRINDYDALT